jgi:hypothetical protein
MSLNNDYQKLEPGNTVRLFEVDGTAFGVGEVLRFHNHNIPHTEAEISLLVGMSQNFRLNPSGGRASSIRRGPARLKAWKNRQPVVVPRQN